MTQSHKAKYIDYHTHAGGCDKYLSVPNTIVVQSLHHEEVPHQRADFLTWGVHPMLAGAGEVVAEWNKTPDLLLDTWVRRLGQYPKRVVAIGECGWDSRSTLSEQEQEQLMDFHIALSQMLHLPMVFHIVRTWHHLLRKHKAVAPTEPWIVHGFRGKKDLAKQLVQSGLMLSLHPQATPHSLPFFLESDDEPILVQSSYQRMAQELAISEKKLAIHIECLFRKIHNLENSVARV